MRIIEALKEAIKISCKDIEQKICNSKIEEDNPIKIISNCMEILSKNLHDKNCKIYLDEFFSELSQKNSEKYSKIAKESIDNFKQNNNEMMNIANTHNKNINEAFEIFEECSGNKINIQKFKNVFNSLQTDLLNQLEKANKTIKELENEINEFEKEVNLDPLTKLYNRKALQEEINEINFHIEHEKGLKYFAIMSDIDDFKKINDTYGHIAGDKIIILVSKIIKSAMQQNAKIFRYGGEEFLILIKSGKIEDVISKCGAIIKTIRNNKIKYKGRNIKVTLSIGVSQLNSNENIEDAIERADMALYEAKKSGKDKMVIK